MAEGNVRSLPGGETVHFDMAMGYLAPAEAGMMQEKIARLVAAYGR